MTSSLARASVWFGGLGVGAFVAGPAAAHFGLLPAMAGFGIFVLGILLALVGAVVGLCALLWGSVGARTPALAGFILGVAVVATTAVVAAPGAKYPRINDITTDTVNPPQFVHAQTLPANAGRDLGYPGEEFARQQRAGYPDLQPLRLAVPPDRAFASIQLAAHSMPGWIITREDIGARALEGVDTTWLFRFQDDFVIEVREADGQSIVDMRSKSRDGRGDIGANARRIEMFFTRLAGR